MHSAKYVSAISSRGVTRGLSLLGLFIYKYVADVSFVTVSCRTFDQGFVSQTMTTFVIECINNSIKALLKYFIRYCVSIVALKLIIICKYIHAIYILYTYFITCLLTSDYVQYVWKCIGGLIPIPIPCRYSCMMELSTAMLPVSSHSLSLALQW